MGKADINWKKNHNTSLFGMPYTAATPSVWANQQLGLVTQTHISTHIKASFNKLHFDTSQQPVQDLDNPDPQDDWKIFNGPLNDDIYCDDLHGLDETARTQPDDLRKTDVSRTITQSKLHKNTFSIGRPEGASTADTFHAG